jgi:hypothetical protein
MRAGDQRRAHAATGAWDALATTIAAEFPSVHAVDVPGTFNTIIYATVQPTTAANLSANLAALGAVAPGDPHAAGQGLLRRVLANAAQNLQPLPAGGTVFTDDRAPVEQITNAIVVDFLLNGGFGGITREAK